MPPSAPEATVFVKKVLSGDRRRRFEGGIEEDKKFSGNGDEGDFGRFSVGSEAQIEGLERAFANGGKGSHVKGATYS